MSTVTARFMMPHSPSSTSCISVPRIRWANAFAQESLLILYRHDLDRHKPRTPKEIYGANRMMLDMMQDAFPDIPIIPSLGNNDIYPHNVLAPGPNAVMTEYAK